MIGTLSPEAIETVLQEGYYGHLGFFDGTDPYVLPLLYTYDDGAILGHTYDGHKVEVLKAHPRVCFQVENIMGPSHWQSVAVHGTLTFLSAQDSIVAVQRIIGHIHSLPEDLQGFSPFTHTGHSHALRNDGTKPWLFRIDVDAKSGRFESAL